MPVDETITDAQFLALWKTNSAQFHNFWFDLFARNLYYFRGFSKGAGELLGRVQYGKNTFFGDTGAITGTLAVGTKVLCAWNHSGTLTKKIRIVAIVVSMNPGVAGTQRLVLRRTSNIGAGGTGANVQSADQDDSSQAELGFVFTPAAGVGPNPLFGIEAPVATAIVGLNLIPLLYDGKPLALGTSSAASLELAQIVDSTITTAPIFDISTIWTEE